MPSQRVALRLTVSETELIISGNAGVPHETIQFLQTVDETEGAFQALLDATYWAMRRP